MGIHDEIWHETIGCPRHIVSPEGHSNSPLLTMARRKFIAQLRNTILCYPHLHRAIPFRISHNSYRLYTPACPHLRSQAPILAAPLLAYSGDIPGHQHSLRVYKRAYPNDAALIQLSIVYARLQLIPFRHLLRMCDNAHCPCLLFLSLCDRVRAVVHAAEQTPLEGVSIEHHAVILVVA